MTRINVVDPALLSDAHLGAEYRELPRIFGLVRAAQQRGHTAEFVRASSPQEYVLGSGHCRFFYTRLGWLTRRFVALVAECRRRGRAVNHPSSPTHGLRPEWFGDWTPNEAAVRLNLARIAERGGLRAGVNNPKEN